VAESSTQPPSGDADRDALRKRIQDYIDSGKALQYVKEGFAQAGGGTPFLSLQDFKDRESRLRQQRQRDWYGVTHGQGQLHQGSTSGPQMKGGHHNPLPGDRGLHQANFSQGFNPRCAKQGHDWKPTGPKSLSCSRCGITRSVSDEGAVQYSNPRFEQEVDAVEDFMNAEDEIEEASRICIWCGKVCETIEALDLHEEECEP
jgi:hypothetical protein